QPPPGTAAAGQSEAGPREPALDHARFMLAQIVGHVIQHDLGAGLRGARRRLHLHEEIALVFARQERRRQAQEKDAYRGNDRGVNEEPASKAADHMAYPAEVSGPGAIEAAVKPPEEALFFILSMGIGMEDRGA